MTKMSKKLLLGILIIALVVATYIIFRLFNPSVGFKYYEPSYLPLDVSVKAKRISIARGYIQVEQNFRREDWVYSIREDKADGFHTIGTADQNYDDKSVKPTCFINSSPANMRYRLCHWIDYGRIDVHEVSFIKEGTFVYSQIPTTTSQQISTQDIEKYIDSFKRKSTAGLPILRSSSP